MNHGRLEGRVAVVTGAAAGIGKATAIKLALEGASVILFDISSPRVAEAREEVLAKGGNALFFIGDIGNREEVERMVRDGYGHFGRIDILVNNAGQGLVKPFEEVTEEDWDRVVKVNLKGTSFCTQAVLPIMKRRNYGKIVNIGSRSSLGILDRTVYGATKAGIIGMTRIWALEFATYGINVNCVAPGPIETEHFKRFNPSDSERTRSLIRNIPLKRMGTPEDVANLVSFLASDEASWITGQTIFICGGLTAGFVHW